MTDDDEYTLFNPDDDADLSNAPREAHARRTDPWTSHAAAESHDEATIRESQQAVLRVMRRLEIATDKHLEHVYPRTPGVPWQEPSGIRTRRRELADAGLIFNSGLKEKLPSNRWAILWTTTPPPPQGTMTTPTPKILKNRCELCRAKPGEPCRTLTDGQPYTFAGQPAAHYARALP
jgi:hypothetical protein